MPIVEQGAAGTLSAYIPGPADWDVAPAPTVTVQTLAGVAQAGFPSTVIIHDGLGLYHYVWSVPAAQTTGTYNVHFAGFIGGVADDGWDTVEVVVAGASAGIGRTLADIRALLNIELGVAADGDARPYTVAARNAAISQGYAALATVGVMKPTSDTITTVSGAQSYITTVQELYDASLVDSGGYNCGRLKGRIVQTASGPTLFLTLPIGDGATIAVQGWTPYVSVFASDSAVDDLDSTVPVRIPLLKARSILYQSKISEFVNFSGHQSAPASLNVSVSELLGLRSSVEREWEMETRRIAKGRDRISQPAFARPR